MAEEKTREVRGPGRRVGGPRPKIDHPGRLFKRISGFHSGHTKISSRTFLLLGNHNNDLDWAFPVIDTRRHMRFVASANILEGFKGRIIDFLVGPIPRKKGAPAEETTKQIYESLSQGISVAIYPEGNKSWDGRTGKNRRI